MKSFIFSLLAISILGIATDQAFAKQYIIGVKDPALFSSIASKFQLSASKEAFLFENKSIKITSAFSNLEMIIVDSNSLGAIGLISHDPRIDFIEEEKFIPAPRPIEGFKLTPPWNVSWEYMGTNQSFAKVPQRPWGLDMVKAPQAWELGARGQGVKVAVLDSGIDKNHPALSSAIDDMKDFVGDDNSPYPAADKIGHGTHVAGTIAARIGATGFAGIAPEARLYIGRVCGTSSCSTIDVLAGMDWAASIRARVLNMSLGSQFGSQAEAKAAARLAQAGVLVVAASGNSAEDNPGTVGFPAAYPTVMAVGAVNNLQKRANFSQYGPELDVVAPGVQVMSSVPLGTGKISTVEVNSQNSRKDLESAAFSASKEADVPVSGTLAFCGLGRPSDPCPVSGKIALIQRGEVTFGEKAKYALSKGALAVVIYNNTDGLVSGTLSQDGTVIPIVAVGISQADGLSLKSEIEAGSKIQIGIKTEKTDYAALSGTSMASPHVAGVAALVFSKKPSLRNSDAKRILESTATSIGSKNEYANGLVDAEQAVRSAK